MAQEYYTEDLTDFGYRELDMAGDLLKALKTEKDKTEYLGGNVKLAMNSGSGNVFLVDEDYNVAMMNGEHLEDWFTCPYCGHEGFKEDMKHDIENEECREYLEQRRIIYDK